MRTCLFTFAIFLIGSYNSFSMACDDPAAVDALKAIDAELKYDANGSVIFVDVSELDDIDDDVLVHLAGLPKLKQFHAIYTRITGEGFKHLRNAKQLDILDLYACPITDKGLQQLKHVSQLRQVNLIGSKVTDNSIKMLVGCKKLQYLGVGDSRISPQGIQKLQIALPDCEVE